MVFKIENATKSFGYNKLLDEATVSVSKLDRVGIIGKNGAGKSTLMKIFYGDENIDSGEFSKNPALKYSILKQNVDISENLTIKEYVVKNINRTTVEEYEIKSILNKLNLTDINILFNNLSGGEKRKVSLCVVLLDESDVLLLDEPTNHLDSNMIDWLESYIKKSKKTIVIISHDRYFLDNVCTSIIDLDRGKLYKYDGDFSNAMIKRSERVSDKIAANRKIKASYKIEKQWASRGPQGRGTKSKERMERFEKLKDTKLFVEDSKLEIDNISSRLGNETINIKNLSHAFSDKKIVNDFTYQFQHYDKIGIIGRNGVGKSTFLNLLTKKIEADSGNITYGPTVKLAYFTQNNIDINPRLKVIDFIRDISDSIETSEGVISASGMLSKFLFEPEAQYKYVGDLSGGEVRRLYLLSLLMTQPNVLVLDEPTNDFDVITLDVLEGLLIDFAGIIITVSHDRYFLRQVTNKIFKFTKDGNIEIVNELDDDLLNEFNEPKVKKIKEVRQKENQSKKVKMSYKEKYEWENIDNEIEEIENELILIDKEINLVSNDFAKLSPLLEKRKQVQTKLDEKLLRWEYLFELSEKLN